MRLRKKIATTGVAVGLLVGLTGCMSIDSNIEIKDKSEAVLGYSLSIDKSDYAAMSGLSEGEIQENISESMGTDTSEFENVPGVDFKVDETEEAITYKIAVTVGYDKDGIVIPDEIKNSEAASLTESFNIYALEGDKAKVEFSLDGLSDTAGLDMVYNDIEYSASFPGGVTDSTGGAKVDGNVVTWNYDTLKTVVTDGETKVEATGSVATGFALPIIPILIGLLVVGLGAGAFFFIRSRNKNNDVEGMDVSGYLDQQEQAPQGYYDPTAQSYPAPQQQYPAAPVQGYIEPEQTQAPMPPIPPAVPQPPQQGQFPTQPGNGLNLPPVPPMPPLPPRPGN